MADRRLSDLVRVLFRHTVKPAQLVVRRALSTAVDRRLGVVTTDEQVAATLGLDIGLFRRTWRSLGWLGTWRLLRRLDAHADQVLLDIGCGAGRVVVGAMGRPFGRVIGIEIDPAFAELAARNVARRRGGRCRGEIVVADATEYEVPSDVTVVYLYNPFQGAVFARTLEQIIASHRAAPRELRLVYANPVEHDLVIGSGAWELVDGFRLAWRPGREWARTQQINVYRAVSAAR